MENTQRQPFDGFMGTPAAKGVGLIVAFALCFLMLYLGLYTQYCLFIFVGILLFVIPKFFGVKKFSTLAVFGIVFMLFTTAIGAYCFTVPMLESNTQDNFSDDVFTDLEIIDEGNGNYTVSVKYSGTSPVVVLAQDRVGVTSFGVVFGVNHKDHVQTAATVLAKMTNNSGTYTTKITMDTGILYSLYITSGTENAEGKMDNVEHKSAAFIPTANNPDFANHALTWNAYVTGMTIVIFFLVLVLTTWMRKNLEKTRAKMEAEGRLYPKGYGTCKKCGMVVLPGETNCRKCGEPIEIPEEYRVHKGEQFECSECGAKVPSDAKMCPKCGSKFDEDDEQ